VEDGRGDHAGGTGGHVIRTGIAIGGGSHTDSSEDDRGCVAVKDGAGSACGGGESDDSAVHGVAVGPANAEGQVLGEDGVDLGRLIVAAGDGQGEDVRLEGAHVAGSVLRTCHTSLVSRGTGGIIARVDGSAAGQERVDRGISIIVVQSTQERISTDHIGTGAPGGTTILDIAVGDG